MLNEILKRIGIGILGVLIIIWAFVMLWMLPVWFPIHPPG